MTLTCWWTKCPGYLALNPAPVPGPLPCDCGRAPTTKGPA